MGETGMLVGLIRMDVPRLRYDGYVNDEEGSSKKILRNVFVTGDAYFSTGDLVRCDADGFVYFCDRVGDTFRWKGENVSTTEVAQVLCGCTGIETANVFGVEVVQKGEGGEGEEVKRGTDGRAGMACVTLCEGTDTLDGALLYAHLEHELPVYARPIFVRVQSCAELTSTLKVRKTDVRRDGFDLGRVAGDAVLMVDHGERTYVPLTREVEQQVREGHVRL